MAIFKSTEGPQVLEAVESQKLEQGVIPATEYALMRDVVRGQGTQFRTSLINLKVNSAAQLDFALSALLQNTVQRVQVRYHWNGQHWIDTLKRQADTFHLVRIAHENV